MEFRCFVRGSRLVAACQRHTSDYFPFLADSRRKLSDQLDAFHDETVADVFPHPNCARLSGLLASVVAALRRDDAAQTRTTCT